MKKDRFKEKSCGQYNQLDFCGNFLIFSCMQIIFIYLFHPLNLMIVA